MKILTDSYTFPSARILREIMQRKLNMRIFIVKETRGIRPNEIFVRYGNSGTTQNSDTQYNTATFVRFCSGKYNFSKEMEREKIYSPVYNRNTSNIEFPVVIRKSLSTSGGKGIIVCRDRVEFDKNWNSSYWWTPYVRCDFELRVHILGGEPVRIFKKILENPEVEFPIRNNNCCHFALRIPENYPKLAGLISQISTLKGRENFYAMDVGWDSRVKKYFLFELNSAPGLNENTAELYADFLINKLVGGTN